MRIMLMAVLLSLAGAAHAEPVTCQGTITSIQGEGLVARTHRFEVSGISGVDVEAVLHNCQAIVKEKQNRAARKNPGGSFRKFSDLQLECLRGAEHFAVRRSLRTE